MVNNKDKFKIDKFINYDALDDLCCFFKHGIYKTWKWNKTLAQVATNEMFYTIAEYQDLR